VCGALCGRNTWFRWGAQTATIGVPSDEGECDIEIYPSPGGVGGDRHTVETMREGEAGALAEGKAGRVGDWPQARGLDRIGGREGVHRERPVQ
jgi:hypothetical protein